MLALSLPYLLLLLVFSEGFTMATARALRSASDVVAFWFGDKTRFATSELYKEDCMRRWWSGKDEEFNAVQIENASLIKKVANDDVSEGDWESPHGFLAKALVLDQFPRTVYRGTAEAFATDAKAVAVASEAIDRRLHENWEHDHKHFLFMPFMHHESAESQARSVAFCSELGPFPLSFAKEHKAVIDRFGRFPHRNKLLGRVSTPEEEEWLASDSLPGWARSQAAPAREAK